ncbi:MAG: glycosyltransferase family 4 protein [Chloroflexota bacterium]
MKALFISNYYPPHHLGGYEELCDEVAHGLRIRGHEIAILTSRRGGNQPRTEDGPIFRWLGSEVDYDAGGILRQYLFGRAQRRRRNVAALERILSDWQPQIILTWGGWNLSRDLFAHIEQHGVPPIVYYLADYWPTLPDAFSLHWKAPARSRLTVVPKRLLALGAQMIRGLEPATPGLQFCNALCVSAAVRDRLIKSGIDFGDVRVVHNGIDVVTFKATRSENKSAAACPMRLVYSGRLSPEKGIATAIKAVAILTDADCAVHLTIVGSGSSDYEDELRTQAKTLGVASNVSFLGRIDRSKLPELYARMDIMIVPSIWEDPLPRVIQEGMAAGLVVVGTQIGGIPEIIQDGVNGLLFPPHDSQALADHVSRILTEPDLITRLGTAAVTSVASRFGIDRTITDIEDYLSQVISSSTRVADLRSSAIPSTSSC